MPTTNSAAEAWGKTGSGYTNIVEKVTAKAAERLVQRVNSIKSFSSPEGFVLDNGCGTGALSAAIRSQSSQIPVLATDISPGMVEVLKSKALPSVRTRIADALNLGKLGEDGVDDHFSHVLSSFMIQFTPDATNAVGEMHRVLQPGGVFGLATWIEVGLMAQINEACTVLDPSWEPPELFMSPWPLTVSGVQEKLKGLGFIDVHTEEVSIDAEVPMDVVVDYTYNGKHPSFVNQLKHWEEQGRMNEFKIAFERILGDLYSKDQWLRTHILLSTARKP